MKRTKTRAKGQHGISRNVSKGGIIQETTLCNDKTITTRHNPKCVRLTNATTIKQKRETGKVTAGYDLTCRTKTDRNSSHVNGQQYNRAIRH